MQQIKIIVSIFIFSVWMYPMEISVDYNDLLFQAAETDDIELFRVALSSGADKNYANSNKQTPLHVAVENNSIKIIQELVNVDVNLEIRDSSNMLPLTLAIKHKNSQMVDLLIKAKADVNNDNDGFGIGPLFYAVEHFKKDIMSSLIKANANIHENLNGCCTPMRRAIIENHLEAVKLLLDAKVDPNDHNEQDLSCFSPLHSAGDDAEMVKLLIKEKADVNHIDSLGLTPLASHFNNLISLQLYLDAGADVAIKPREVVARDFEIRESLGLCIAQVIKRNNMQAFKVLEKHVGKVTKIIADETKLLFDLTKIIAQYAYGDIFFENKKSSENLILDL